MSGNDPNDPVEIKRRRQERNIAVFLGLLAFVVLLYGVTIVKIKASYGP